MATPAFRRRLRRAALPALAGAALHLLVACAAAPLDSFDRIAVAPARTDPIPRERVTVDVASAALGQAAARSRFAVVSSSAGLTPATVVVHPRVRLFEPPAADASGAAAVDYLFTDVHGNPVLAASTFAVVPPGAKDADLGAALEGRFARVLERAGATPRLPREAGLPVDRDELAIVDAVRPRGAWPQACAPGRFGVRVSLSLAPLEGTSAGEGAGAPDFDEAFSTGVGSDLLLGYAVAPGLEFWIGGGRIVFPGRRYAFEGLEVDFDPMRFGRLFGEVRLGLPVAGARWHRWWSGRDPLPDARGILLFGVLRAGAGFCESVDLTVVQDDTASPPFLGAGERIPYYRRGAAFFGECLAALTVRLGDGRIAAVDASLFAGFFFSNPPAERGVGSESGWVLAVPLGMEAAVRF